MTDTTDLNQTASAQGPVTLDDVRAAINELDPNKTNAQAIRDVLRRGSLSTIQKYLNVIRSESAAQLLEVGGHVPDAPKELVGAIWSHAWTTAQSRTAGALAQAQQQVQMLNQALTVAQDDADAAQNAADEIRVKLDSKTIEFGELQGKFEEAFDKVATELEASRAEVEKLNAERSKDISDLDSLRLKEISDLRHQIDLISRDREIEKKTLQATIDKLVEQLTEYKSLLMNLKPNQ